MSVKVMDFNTIISLVEDEEAFCRSIYNRALLDTDHDGLLSNKEMQTELQSLRVFETHFGIDVEVDPIELSCVYGSILGKFDHDSNGIVDFEKFKEKTKQIMLAIANGFGILPVQMVLEEGSFLKIAVDHELDKISI